MTTIIHMATTMTITTIKRSIRTVPYHLKIK